MDSAKYRAVQLIELLDYTKNMCLKIAEDKTETAKDRIEQQKQHVKHKPISINL
jgi:hypothetical protein